jgi:CRISPR-associated protein Cas1
LSRAEEGVTPYRIIYRVIDLILNCREQGVKVGKNRVNLVIDTWGSYLHTEQGCFIVKDRWGDLKRYPFNDDSINEVWIRTGNAVSVDALTALASFNVDVLLATQNRKPVAMLRSLIDDSHVKTRVCQYESFKNDKWYYIAKQILLSKIEGQRRVLRKWGIEERYKPDRLIESGDIRKVRTSFTGTEGKYAEHYYRNIFKLIPENIRPERRRTYRAYDGLNNIFNLGYEMLKWKVHRALINAKLEPFLGYLHSSQFAKPSLVCDFQELYRFIIDDFLIKYCQGVRKKDFILTIEELSKTKTIKRVFLNDLKADELADGINGLFETQFEIPRIRNGQRQGFDTLISEEAQLFAKYLRGERKTWVPRIPSLD